MTHRTVAGRHELLVTALAVLVVLVAMLAATALLGWHVSGIPGGYDLVADPAGTLPF